MPHNQWTVRAGAAPGELIAALRDAYGAQPGAMPIGGVTLNPLEVVTVDSATSRCYRVPVTVDRASGAFNFAAPIAASGPGASRLPASSPRRASGGVSALDQQRIHAAVARGALPSDRAAFWVAKAVAGEDISRVDQLVAVLPVSPGKVAASREDADYQAMFGARAPQGDADSPEYSALFGTIEQGQRAADAVQAAAWKQVTALTDDELFDQLFAPGISRTSAATPVTASAAGPAGQHGRGGVARKRYRVKAPYVTLRVPQGSNGVAAGAEPAQTSWRTVELRGGDRVPEDAHPDDIARLLHQKNRLGPLIKPW